LFAKDGRIEVSTAWVEAQTALGSSAGTERTLISNENVVFCNISWVFIEVGRIFTQL